MEKNRELSNEAGVLLKWLKGKDERIAEFFWRPITVRGIDPLMLEETIAFFTANSPITATVLASPGSSIISELLYDRRATASEIDSYFYESKGGLAVRGRLEAVQRELPSRLDPNNT